MRRRDALLAAALAIAVLCSGLSIAAPVLDRTPHRYLPNALDGRPVVASYAAEGLEASAWAYRNGAEYDLAISFRDASGTWTEPRFFGEYDGIDQVRPALAFDAAGNLYVAYVERPTSGVKVLVRSSATGLWSTPLDLTLGRFRAQTVALRVVGDRLVVAFGNARELEMIDLELLLVGSTQGIIDNPDPIDSNGEPPEDEDNQEQQQSVGSDEDGSVGPVQPRSGRQGGRE